MLTDILYLSRYTIKHANVMIALLYMMSSVIIAMPIMKP